jgi:hypothetical protein
MAGKTLDIKVTVKDLVTGNIKRIGAGLRNMAKSVGSAFASVGKTVFSLKGALAALGLGAIGRSVLQAASDVETWRTQLQALIGDQTEANKVLQDMRDFAAESPLATKDVVDSFVQLKAVGIDAAESVVKQLGNAALVFNKDVSAVTSAFVGLNSRTLRELGVEMERTGKTAKVMSGGIVKEVENSSEGIRGALLEIFEERFPDAMSLVQEDFETKMAVMKSGFFELMAGIGEAVFPFVKKLVDGISNFVGNNREILLGIVQGIPERFGIALGNMEGLAKSVEDFLKNLVVNVINGVQGIRIAWNGVTLAVRTVFLVAVKLAEMITKGVGGAIQFIKEQFGDLVAGASRGFAEIARQAAKLSGRVKGIGDGLEAVAGELQLSAAEFDAIGEGTNDWGEGLEKIRKSLEADIGEDLNDIDHASGNIVVTWQQLEKQVRKTQAAMKPPGEEPGAPGELETPELSPEENAKIKAMQAEVDARAATLKKIEELNLFHGARNQEILDSTMALEKDKREAFLNSLVTFEQQTTARRLAITSSFLSTGLKLAQAGGEKTAKLAKALALSQAIVSGITAIQQALAAPPGWPFNAGMVAAVSAMQAANVALIAKQSFGATTAGGGGGARIAAPAGGGGGAATGAATGPAFGGPEPAPAEPMGRKVSLTIDGLPSGPAIFESGDKLAQFLSETMEQASEAGALG